MWTECASCHFRKFLRPGERVCPACTDRGHPATLDGARALELLEGQYDNRDMAETRTRERYRAADEVSDGFQALKWLGENASITLTHSFRDR